MTVFSGRAAQNCVPRSCKPTTEPSCSSGLKGMEGKTFTMHALAHSLAANHKRVLMLDTNFKTPLAEKYTDTPTPNSAILNKIIKEHGFSNIFPAEKSVQRPEKGAARRHHWQYRHTKIPFRNSGAEAFPAVSEHADSNTTTTFLWKRLHSTSIPTRMNWCRSQIK